VFLAFQQPKQGGNMAAVQDNAVEVTVKSPLGLHGRPAAHIVKLASNYNADVTVRNLDSGEVGDCSSILSLLVLAANHGTRLLLSACVRRTIENSLSILGVSAPEKM